MTLVGKKTIIGAILIGLGGVVEALKYTGILDPGIMSIIEGLLGSLGAALGIAGIGSKIQRVLDR
jgi:hypothetical protein